jgi:hypothetical protein
VHVEEALLRAFIVPERRRRCVDRLATPRTRAKLLDGFHHLRDLDPRYAVRIEPREQHAGPIHDALRARGAPDRCYVMSASSDLDGRTAELRSALEEIVGHASGTFVSCLPGRLAYFEGEEPNERYLLERPPGA